VDGTAPLLADVAYLADGRPKPLLVVMHGYGGGRAAVAQDLRELAPRGVFALAPDMRGRGGSAGQWDSGGLDVHDILDAVLAALARYPGETDARNLNLVGYSGGGGNAIACMVRFPDLFQTVVSFFGIADYAGWHRSGGRPDCNQWMEQALGGTPEQRPEVYTARNAIPAAGNAACGRLHFVWDEEETMCPPALVQAWLSTHRAAGLANASVHISHAGDPRRWIHNYRSGNPDLSAADDLYLPDVLAPKAGSPRLPPRGRLVVPGYLVTRHFQVWVEDGQRGRVAIDYELTGAVPRIRVTDNPGAFAVRVDACTPLQE
jgi:pimeloyl-ACP methyl ester carboxylesterase